MDRTFSKNITKSRSSDAAKAVPSMKIEKLFEGFREVRLFHGSEEYRLSLTKNNKLILTK
jgi:hemin uptake protein HemP